MLALRRRLQQRGDTIVEVMVVLAVLGSAIAISYSTANRSLLNARQAQESSRATVIAQSQVEQLRALSAITDTHDANYLYKPATLAQKFCIGQNQPNIIVPYTTVTPDAPPPSACQYDKTDSFEYDVSIAYDHVHPDENAFTIQVLYDDVLGEGQDSVTLNYRVHQPVESL